MSTARPREVTRRLAAIDANIFNAQQPDGAGNRASALVLQISIPSIREIDGLISELKDLRTKIENRCSRIRDDIGDFAELSQSAVQLTKIVLDSVAQVERTGSNNSSGTTGLEVVPLAPTQ